ncbi:hypothetical protein ACFPN4_01205 [Ureibacillus thermophilus]|uniref:hypothetical protein n=1 Tax=Ureibacillus TaxID=160795 RepID=UPI003158D918
MDILIPIGIGFLSNIVVFVISFLIVKNKLKATNITLGFFAIVLLTSLIIGEWLGMGIGVISFGMLIFSLCIYLYIFIERTLVK